MAVGQYHILTVCDVTPIIRGMEALLQDVEAFLAMSGMSATRLGDQAIGDRHFVRQLRAGRRVWPETEAKVRRFMATYRAPEQARAA